MSSLVKVPGKRGRPKKRNSDQEQSDEQFLRKKSSKRVAKSNAAKRKQDNQKTRKGKIKSKNKFGFSESGPEDSQVSLEIKEVQPKLECIPIEPFNCDKVFAEILNRANKQPQFLIMLKNLLSGCSRTLDDKKKLLKRKWMLLGNSNLTQDQYLGREAQLKRVQFEQIHQIERDIMNKLSQNNIRGFESRQTLIDDHKAQLGTTTSQCEYYIQDGQLLKYHEEQRKLLTLLMKENDFVSADYQSSKLIKTYSEPAKQPNGKDSFFEDNQMNLKFNNIETQENPQSTQFLFCKQYSDINYDKVFQNINNPFRVTQGQIFLMDAKAMSWLLETKSDQIYTNDKFQKETYRRYTKMLQNIYMRSHELSSQQLMEQLLEIAAYILNSVHYYQKFKLKCDLLHPLDLLLIIEKIKKQKREKQRERAKLEKEKEGKNGIEVDIQRQKEIQKYHLLYDHSTMHNGDKQPQAFEAHQTSEERQLQSILARVASSIKNGQKMVPE